MLKNSNSTSKQAHTALKAMWLIQPSSLKTWILSRIRFNVNWLETRQLHQVKRTVIMPNLIISSSRGISSLLGRTIWLLRRLTKSGRASNKKVRWAIIWKRILTLVEIHTTHNSNHLCGYRSIHWSQNANSYKTKSKPKMTRFKSSSHGVLLLPTLSAAPPREMQLWQWKRRQSKSWGEPIRS